MHNCLDAVKLVQLADTCELHDRQALYLVACYLDIVFSKTYSKTAPLGILDTAGLQGGSLERSIQSLDDGLLQLGDEPVIAYPPRTVWHIIGERECSLTTCCRNYLVMLAKFTSFQPPRTC